jgi:hypothetical protein
MAARRQITAPDVFRLQTLKNEPFVLSGVKKYRRNFGYYW